MSRRNESSKGGGGESALTRFAASMSIDYEKWHDGIGYDLAALREAGPEERREIEALLLARRPPGWREVEALAELDTPKAREALRAAMRNGDAEVRMAVARHAPSLITEHERVASLVRALESAEFFDGLSQALAEAEELHPPEVVSALLRGARERDGAVAVHFAALLLFLHGKADSPFDMEQRPFFLRFNTRDRTAREAVFAELCARIEAV